MQFTVEKIFLTDDEGRPAPHRVEFFLIEADTVDAALQDFLRNSEATLVGTIEKFPGFHAFAKARAGTTMFTVQLLPGSDGFRHHKDR